LTDGALLIGLAYHGTVLSIVWKTVKGSKGHVIKPSTCRPAILILA